VAVHEPLLLWGPEDAAIRRVFTTMQQMIRAGRIGQAVVFSIHEGVDREVGRGHMSSWVGTAVQTFSSRLGVGSIELFLHYQRPSLRTRRLAGTASQPVCGAGPGAGDRGNPWSSIGSLVLRCC
jgi:hypothetical protein